ncbi:MAG: hypothetical protein GX937_10640 [Lentisphaerae bacterium]|jgi:hypothetical protein|nr:hypothetical protein [Lentisphaerota bacterium]
MATPAALIASESATTSNCMGLTPEQTMQQVSENDLCADDVGWRWKLALSGVSLSATVSGFCRARPGSADATAGAPRPGLACWLAYRFPE